MIGRAVALELFHLGVGLLITAAIFWAAAWGYPQGYATIWTIGFLTMAAVLAMSVPELAKAKAADRVAGHGEKV